MWLITLALASMSVLAFSPHPFRRFGRFVLFSAYDGFKYSESFINSLAVNISLSDETKCKLQLERMTQNVILGLSRHDFEVTFNISVVDAVSLAGWSREEKRRLKEEEDEKRRLKVEEKRRLKEEEEEKRRLKVEKERRLIVEEERRGKTEEWKKELKAVFIFNDMAKVFEQEIFPDDYDLRFYLNSKRVGCLSSLADDDSSSVKNVRNVEYLVNGSFYSLPDKSPEAVDVLRQELIKSDKTKAEWSVNTFLSEYLKKSLRYIGSEIVMRGPLLGDNRGDIDTLYISEDRSVVVLLERKTMLSEDETSVLELFTQINKTTHNFSQQNTTFLCNSTIISMKRGVDYNSDATIVVALYCKAGPVSVFNKLREAQIHVIMDALKYFPPLACTQTL